MENYTNNSHKYKEKQRLEAEEKAKVEKVVKGSVVVKENKVKKFADVFFAEDINSVKSHIIMDVIIPAIKKTLSDVITDSAQMIFFGKRYSGSSNARHVSYSSFSDDRRYSSYTDRPATEKRGLNYDDLIFETRSDANEVLDRMGEMVSTYGVVSVADMYDAAGVTCDYTLNRYGWTSIRNAEVVHGYNGYLIKLPRALPIDR